MSRLSPPTIPLFSRLRARIRRWGLIGLGLGALLLPALVFPGPASAEPPAVNSAPVAVDDPGVPCGNLDSFGGSFPVPEDWVGDYDGWFVLFGDCGLLANDSDPDGDPLTWEVYSQPAHGEALFVDVDFFAYKADRDYSTLPGDEPGGDWVSDSFTYRAFDGTAYSDPATMRFWVAPVNDPPTFTPGLASASTDEDVAYEGAWATAISPGPLNESHQTVGFEIVQVDNPSLFSVGPAIDGDGVLSFTPAPDASGSTQVTVIARDDGGLEDYNADGFEPPDDTSEEVSFDIEIRPVNDPPVASNVAASVDEDVPSSIWLLDDYTDPENNSADLGSVSDPAHGSASVIGGGALYEPDPDFTGTDTFTYTIDDGQGAEDTATVTVTVDPINDDPVADDDAATMLEDAVATLILVRVGDTDVDGDVLHVAQAYGATKGTVTITGTQLAVRYKPFRNVFGIDTFTYLLTDGHGGRAYATVEVTIDPVNDPPNAVGDGSASPLFVVRGSGATALNVLANDTSFPDEGEFLSIVAVTQPAHGVVAIDGGALNLTYDPNGQYAGSDQFTYTISDGNGGTDTATVRVSVGPAITLPVVSAPRVVVAGGSSTTAVRADVVWTAISAASGIARYQLQRQVDGGGWATVALPAPTATRLLLTLQTGHDYRFRVRGVDGAGNYGAYATSRLTRL